MIEAIILDCKEKRVSENAARKVLTHEPSSDVLSDLKMWHTD
jgi:hypothetical protein